MAGKILIDTNVLLDYLLEREPFFEDAKKVISSWTGGNTKGCIAAHSISNMFFILRKDYTAKATVTFIPSGECCDQPFRWLWMMTFW